MKCTNCGAELQDGTLFCSECGTKVILPESQASAANNFAQSGVQGNFGQTGNNIYAGAPDPAASTDGGKKKGGIKKILIPIIILIVIAAVAIGGAVFYITSRPVEVNLKDYITVSFDGYDTLGTATVTFDSKKFRKDYGEKIKYHGKDKKKKDEKAKDLIDDYLTNAVSLDKSDNLTNGDKVTVKFKFGADELLADLNIKTSTDGITFDVKGLESVPTFDPFEGLEVTYSGTAPEAYASIDDSNVDNEYFNAGNYFFDYDYEELRDLDNGDVFTITINYDESKSDEEYIKDFVQTYGAMPTAVSKEYTVEGLPVAITKVNQITDDIRDQIQAYLEDKELVYTSDDIGSEMTDDGTVTISNVDFYGMYVGEPLEDSYRDCCIVYMTYKITLKYEKEEYSYYWVVGVDDLVLDGDGNLMTEKITTDTYKHDYLRHDFKGGMRIYGYYGYEVTTDLEDDLSYYASYYNFKWVLAGSNGSGSSDDSTTGDSATTGDSTDADDSTEGTSEETTEEETTEEETAEEDTEETEEESEDE